MLIVTAKLSKGKLIGIVAAAAALLILIIFLANRGTGTSMETAGSGKLDTPERRIEYLSSLGYTVEAEPVRTQEVLIPKEWNEVYEQYAAIQSSQGFKLTKWSEPDSDPVYATLVCYKGRLIAGELTRGGENGFLRPLLST